MADVILFDTDVLIDASRDVPEAVDALREAPSRGRLAVSVITQMELTVGCRSKRELRALDQFLLRFDVVPLSRAISEQAADLLRTYRLSHGLLIPDALIAATVVIEKIPLVPKNQRDYQLITALNLKPYPDPFAE